MVCTREYNYSNMIVSPPTTIPVKRYLNYGLGWSSRINYGPSILLVYSLRHS